IRQVAGLVARRIVTDVKTGQVLGRGKRIGMIKFGSRVELLVPHDRLGEIAVRVGQKVKAGRTVLAGAGAQEAAG
ncbi:MAG TPA: phosphatidylserine decarboxylase, partial [Phycisphaerae bacterium]|nr:phosphatidylserine decarboxylase [Phycisphaerae bacterium]